MAFRGTDRNSFDEYKAAEENKNDEDQFLTS